MTNAYQSVFIPEIYVNRDGESIARELEGIFGLPYKDYYIFWGSIEPKKNIGRLIEAYLASGVSAPLVIVGAQAWKAENELKLLDDLRIGIGPKTNVIQLNYVPFALLMNSSKVRAAPFSPHCMKDLGFRCWRPCSLARPLSHPPRRPLPEVAGDAALLVNPYDTAEIVRALTTLDADADLRAELSQRGLRQAQLFSQAAHMAKLQQVYDQVFVKGAPLTIGRQPHLSGS